MELSSAHGSDVLLTNALTSYAFSTGECWTKKGKTTPRKCKGYQPAWTADQPRKIKKSSSLHNIENLMNEDDTDEQRMTSSSSNVVRQTATIDKQQVTVNSELLSRIEKEKKQYEAKISELVQTVETRKKEKERLTVENRQLSERVRIIQRDMQAVRGENDGLKIKLQEMGVATDGYVEKLDDRMDILNASGDTATDTHSLTQATVGDASSVDQLSDDSSVTAANNEGTQNDILRSLAVSTLQDRIMKMEEDNYSTNEELQATMQELMDLQRALENVNEENRNLSFEREILLESLCEQTQKLQKCRMQIDNLKYFVINSGSGRRRESLDAKLHELYCSTEDENRSLVVQNEEFKQTIVSLQNECSQLGTALETSRNDLVEQEVRITRLEEVHKEEVRQRQQVEALMRNNFTDRLVSGWKDCSDGVLSVIQANKSLTADIAEKCSIIDNLSSKVKQLDSNLRQLHSDCSRKESDNIETLRQQLDNAERSVEFLTQSCESLTQKYAADIVNWRCFEKDLLIAVAAANALKEDKDRELEELQTRLDHSEYAKRQLQEKIDAMTSVSKQKGRESQGRPSLVISKASQASPTPGATNNTVRTLIQTIEDQVKAVNTPSNLQVPCNKNGTNSSNNTVPRSNTLIKHNSVRSKEITRSNTVKTNDMGDIIQLRSSADDTSTVKPRPIVIKQASSSSLETSNVTRPQPLTTVVSQASTILQTVSRLSSVTDSVSSDHSNCSTPTSSAKSPSPPPLSADPLSNLVKMTNKGSKRNALLYWCQKKISNYSKIELTNFSSSWNDGLALCALLHSCDPNLIDIKKLSDATSANPDKNQKRINFKAAVSAAESIGISSHLDIESMINIERPDWNSVMNYVVEIYKHFGV